MTTKGDGLESGGQEELARKVFHGSAGYASVLDAMMAGKGFYAPLFQRHELEVNRQNNEFRTDGFMMELLPMFHLNEGARYMLHDPGFTRADIATMKGTKNTPSAPVSGRNLTEKALTVLANYKFALKYHDEYMVGGKYPSGKLLPDLLLYVRQKMFVRFKGAKNNNSNSKRDKKKKEKELTEEDMPVDYMFSGWLAFVLLGPQGVSEMTLSCLAAGSNKDTAPKKGRAAIRKEEAQRKDAERSAGVGATGPYKRGVTGNTDLVAQNVDNSHMKEATRNIRELLAIANTDHMTCLKHLEQLDKMIENAERRGIEGAVDHLIIQQGLMFEELTAISKRKRSLQASSDLLVAESLAKRPALAGKLSGAGVPGVIQLDQDSSSNSMFSSCPSNISLGRATLLATPTVAAKGPPKASSQSSSETSSPPELPPLRPRPEVPRLQIDRDPSQTQEEAGLSQGHSEPEEGYPFRQPSQLPAEDDDRLRMLHWKGMDRATRKALEQARLNHSNAHSYYAGEESDND